MIKVKVVASSNAKRDDGAKVAEGEIVFLGSNQMPLEVLLKNKEVVACKSDLGILVFTRPVEFALDDDGQPVHGLRGFKSA